MEASRSSSRLKQRLASMLRSTTPSFLRSSCNPSTSSAVSSTASGRHLLKDLNDTVQEPAFVPHRLHLRHLQEQRPDVCDIVEPAASLSFRAALGDGHRQRQSVDCGGCHPTTCALDYSQSSRTAGSAAKRTSKKQTQKKKERRVRETGGYYVTGDLEGRTCPPVSPSSPLKSSYYSNYFINGESKETKKEARKKKLCSNAYGFTSSSSSESNDELGFFSSEEEKELKEEETETFFSSRSLSSDSSELYQRKKKKTTKKNQKSQYPPRQRAAKSKCDNWGSCSGFQPVVSVNYKASAEIRKKVKKEEVDETKEEEEEAGFAVMKRSSDPYADFRNSMVEMIVERQLFGAEDLERLLQSYLSLNSTRHHPVILQAFSDIWVVLFGH